MSWATVNTAIKTILSGVSGIGVVMGYDPHATDWGVRINYFRHTDHTINGWSFTRSAAPSERTTIAAVPKDRNTHIVSMVGLYEIAGDGSATELTFQALVDAVKEAFRQNKTLGLSGVGAGPVQGDMIHNDEFGNVWCHHAELSMEVWENTN